ncbi:SDR family oxidoreductase [Dyadobacter subterraneus]|uniref:SDR family NAD(P)-dependent oxidoreductase n=1 Tax=Dyadobacter subterraneus TaxID=2773304 RepID=A0ABR9WB42_9BACT|nr:SDR family NAD(P)-dependent oxidoreductase [Dyadobacter subterraneus]MBE9462701.1 SDR family NAD(P)-dependent oxidoreductase [Dyadobacter subterraneus]
MDIKNKTALVTGAGSGIGYQIAKLLKEQGNNVIIAGRNAEKITKAAEELSVTALVCDLTKPADIEALVSRVKTEFPELSILVNNAGVAHLYKLGEGADAFTKATAEFQVNYFGPVLLTEKLLPILKQQPEAAVINITSNVTFHPLVVLPTYSDTKAALHSHTVALRHTLAKDTAVKVYEVMPSLVNTEATKDMGGESGMHPGEVAQATLAGIKAGQYEIYVGDTGSQRAAYLANPENAVASFNNRF